MKRPFYQDIKFWIVGFILLGSIGYFIFNNQEKNETNQEIKNTSTQTNTDDHEASSENISQDVPQFTTDFFQVIDDIEIIVKQAHISPQEGEIVPTEIGKELVVFDVVITNYSSESLAFNSDEPLLLEYEEPEANHSLFTAFNFLSIETDKEANTDLVAGETIELQFIGEAPPNSILLLSLSPMNPDLEFDLRK